MTTQGRDPLRAAIMSCTGSALRVLCAGWLAVAGVMAVSIPAASQSAENPAANSPQPESKTPAVAKSEDAKPGQNSKAPAVQPATAPAPRRSGGRLIGAICFVLGALIGLVAGHYGLLEAFGFGRRTAPGSGAAARSGNAASETPGAREAFRRQCREFRDIYGTIWRAAESDEETEDTRRRMLARWDDRIRRLGQPPLLGAWTRATAGAEEAPQQAARQWIKALQAWGVRLDHPRVVQVNADALERFHVYPEAQSGTAEVKEPCWTFEGDVLQKGHAVPLAAGR
jgi:hypothetical protein